MSVLKNIVVFMFCLQLALQVTNHIEIIPGLYLNTGQISPYLSFYDPLSDIINAINAAQNAFNGVFTPTDWDLWGIIVGILTCILSSLIALFSIIGLFALIIYNMTLGAIPFYVALFSLFDPVLGAILGVCVGAVQLLFVVWGLTEFIPAVPNREA